MSLADPKTNLQSHASSLRGFTFIAIAVTFWGGSASLAKFLFAAHSKIDTLILSQTRSTFSFFLLALYFGFMDRSVFRIERRDIPKLAILGVLGIAVTNFSYYFTVKESTVATAILIQYTAPVLVMVYSVIVSKDEQFNGVKMLSLLLALCGCYLAVSGGSVSDIRLSGWALASGVTSAVCFAFLLIASKRILRKYTTWTMLIYAFGFAGLFWLIVNPPWVIIHQEYSASDWGFLWLFAIVSILIPHSIFTASLKMLEASTASIASTLEPVIAIVIAYVALGEALQRIQIVGAIAVMVAVILLQLHSRRSLKFPGR